MGTMKVHVLQHVPFEDVGGMANWFAARGAEVTYTRLHAGAGLPERRDVDLIVALGGPMSVNDHDAHPWLPGEKSYIRRAIEDGTPVLGVCLGAQLIASALGCRVYPAVEKEIGWFPVYATPAAAGFLFPLTCDAFHWHGETFDLPDGAERLARSNTCENQAFQLGGNVIGLQFHLEMTREGVGAMVENCGHELVAAPHIQSRDRILSASDIDFAENHRVMDGILSYLTGTGRPGVERSTREANAGSE